MIKRKVILLYGFGHWQVVHTLVGGPVSTHERTILAEVSGLFSEIEEERAWHREAAVWCNLWGRGEVNDGDTLSYCIHMQEFQ